MCLGIFSTFAAQFSTMLHDGLPWECEGLDINHLDMTDTERPSEGIQSGFPPSPSAFDADPRVSFSKLDDKFILETDEGNEFEWDTALRRWIPVVGLHCNTLRSRTSRHGEMPPLEPLVP